MFHCIYSVGNIQRLVRF